MNESEPKWCDNIYTPFFYFTDSLHLQFIFSRSKKRFVLQQQIVQLRDEEPEQARARGRAYFVLTLANMARFMTLKYVKILLVMLRCDDKFKRLTLSNCDIKYITIYDTLDIRPNMLSLLSFTCMQCLRNCWSPSMLVQSQILVILPSFFYIQCDFIQVVMVFLFDVWALEDVQRRDF